MGRHSNCLLQILSQLVPMINKVRGYKWLVYMKITIISIENQMIEKWIWSELLNYKKLLNIFYSWFTLKSIEEKNKISNKRFDGKKKIKVNSILFIV